MSKAAVSSSPNEARLKIAEVVGDSVYQAMGLKECLEDERTALENQDAEALSAAIEGKEKCIVKLVSLEKERSQLGAAAGFKPGPEQMAQLQESSDDDSSMTKCWQHLMQIAAQCNDLNNRNGAIVRLRKHQIDASLCIVRGDRPGTGTYGRNGAEPAGQHKRPLAEA